MLKGLFTLTLLVSLWALPGYAGKVQVRKRVPVQNELIVSERKISKTGISFKKIYCRIHPKAIQADLYKAKYEKVIRVHNILAGNLLRNISDKDIPAIQPILFAHIKTIPPSSDDFPFLLRG